MPNGLRRATILERGHQQPPPVINPQFSCHVTKRSTISSYLQIEMTPSIRKDRPCRRIHLKTTVRCCSP